MERTDVAHLWWQDDVRSSRVTARRVKSGHHVVDLAKALSRAEIARHAESRGSVNLQQSARQQPAARSDHEHAVADSSRRS